MKASHRSNLMSLICCQMLILIHQTIPLLNTSLTLSGLQWVCLMGCLMHLLCESAHANIQMQKTEAEDTSEGELCLHASDLVRYADKRETPLP
jgi:hypothetical protein